MLIFDIELIDFIEAPSPPAQLNPPKSASRTKSNKPFSIKRKSLKGHKPSQDSKLILHYNIWSSKGDLLQSTQTGNAPISVNLSDIQPEWQEMISEMRIGDRATLWDSPEKSTLKSFQKNPTLLHELILIDIQ
jgi:hypothetical protein